MLSYKLPNGQVVRLPRVGETVQVEYANRPEWGRLAAIVVGEKDAKDEQVNLTLMVLNPYTWPNKMHVERAVPHAYYGGDVRWNPIPQV